MKFTVSSRFTAATGEFEPSGVLLPVLRAGPEICTATRCGWLGL